MHAIRDNRISGTNKWEIASGKPAISDITYRNDAVRESSHQCPVALGDL
jgi:hypothetical protein